MTNPVPGLILREWRFRETGEFRRARRGEWWVDSYGKLARAIHGTPGPVRIVALEE